MTDEELLVKSLQDPVLSSLAAEIRELYFALSKAMQERWSRSLPLEELVFDRWERAKTLGFGVGTSLYHNAYVYGDVKVGRNTWIGPFTLLDGSGGLEIGDNCSISAGVHIYTHDTVSWAVTNGVAKYEQSPVRIGNCCHIGAHSVITRGVVIGDHCIIGACSFVKAAVPSFSVAAGTPARVVRRIAIDKDGQVRLLPLTGGSST